jgi:hypothetical protein
LGRRGAGVDVCLPCAAARGPSPLSSLLTHGVGNVLPGNVQGGVARSLLEEGGVEADVGSRAGPDAADESRDGVSDEGSVEVGRDHDVELGGLGDELHHAVVDNNLLVFEGRVQLK